MSVLSMYSRGCTRPGILSRPYVVCPDGVARIRYVEGHDQGYRFYAIGRNDYRILTIDSNLNDVQEVGTYNRNRYDMDLRVDSTCARVLVVGQGSLQVVSLVSGKILCDNFDLNFSPVLSAEFVKSPHRVRDGLAVGTTNGDFGVYKTYPHAGGTLWKMFPFSGSVGSNLEGFRIRMIRDERGIRRVIHAWSGYRHKFEDSMIPGSDAGGLTTTHIADSTIVDSFLFYNGCAISVFSNGRVVMDGANPSGLEAIMLPVRDLSSAFLTPTGDLAVGTLAGQIHTFRIRLPWSHEDTPEIERLNYFEGHAGEVSTLSAPTDFSVLLSGGVDGTIRRWSPTHRRVSIGIEFDIRRSETASKGVERYERVLDIE